MDRNSTKRLDLSLDDILVLAEQGALALPDFQRPFSWGRDEVRGLLASVFMGWPAGLILLMEAPSSNFFAMRSLEGLPPLSSSGVRHIILDGQQRVTTLCHAFGVGVPPSDSVWHVDVSELEKGLENGDIEEAFLRIRPEQKQRIDSTKLLIPIPALRSPRHFQSWRDQALATLINEGSGEGELFDRLNSVWHRHLSVTLGFSFPCTVLPARMPLASVARIFEKLNTAGMPLDTFDLVVAHVYRDGYNLRAMWELEVSARPLLRSFSPRDPLIAAELVALVEIGDTRRSALLGLRPEQLWEMWRPAVDALEDAAFFLVDRAGIANAEQLPHRGLYLSLAGAAFSLRGLQPEWEDIILHWTYRNGLSERFNEAVNTRVVTEAKALVHSVKSQVVESTPPELSSLLGATRRGNGSIYRTVQAMIRRNRPVDYPDGLVSLPMAPEWARPISILHRPQSRSSESALGLILGGPSSERNLANIGPKRARVAIAELTDSELKNFTGSQLLPPLTSDAWDSEESFIKARGAIVLKELKSLRSRATSAERRDARSVPEGEGAVPPVLLTVEVAMELAHTLLEQGNPRDAANALRLMQASAEPRSAEESVASDMLLADALTQTGDIEGAANVLRRAGDVARRLEMTSLRASAMGQLGALLARTGQVEEGLSLLLDARAAAEADGLSGDSWWGISLDLAESLEENGQLSASKEVAEDLILRSHPEGASSEHRARASRLLRGQQPGL